MRPARSVLVVVAACGALSVPASAFKLEMHVWVAQQVLDDVLPDGKVTIELGGNPVMLAVDPDVVESLRRWPMMYRKGSIGPDTYPDMVAHQMTLHPGLPDGMKTDEWLRFILAAVPRGVPSPELAFGFGYTSHMAGDLWAHSYVNTYSGGIFELGDPDVAVRHMALEEYLKDHAPPLPQGQPFALIESGDAALERTHAEFVRDLFILNPTVRTQYAKLSPQLDYLVFMQDYMAKLDEMIARFDTGAADVDAGIATLQGQIDALKNRRVCIPNPFGDDPCYRVYPAYCFLDPGTCIALAASQAHLSAAELTIDASLTPIRNRLETWRGDVRSVFADYIDTSEQVARHLMLPVGHLERSDPAKQPLGLVKAWLCRALPVLAGQSKDVVGGACTVLSVPATIHDDITKSLIDFDQRLEDAGVPDTVRALLSPGFVLALKQDFIEHEVTPRMTALAQALVRDLAGCGGAGIHAGQPECTFSDLVTLRLAEVGPDKLREVFNSDGENLGLLELGDSIVERVNKDMGLLVPDGDYGPAKFPPVYNAIVLSKLALLGPAQLNALARQAGVTGSIYGNSLYQGTPGSPFNILIDAVRSIDGNHQWQEIPPAYPRRPPITDDEERQYGYPFSPGKKGFRLWQDCEARDAVFTRIFEGPFAPGFQDPSRFGLPALAFTGQGNLASDEDPFPLSPDSALPLKQQVAGVDRTFSVTRPSDLVVGIDRGTCGGVDPVSESECTPIPGFPCLLTAKRVLWDFEASCSDDFMCRCPLFGSCTCTALVCPTPPNASPPNAPGRLSGLIFGFDVPAFERHALPNTWFQVTANPPAVEGLGTGAIPRGAEWNGSLICDRTSTRTNLIMLPDTRRVFGPRQMEIRTTPPFGQVPGAFQDTSSVEMSAGLPGVANFDDWVQVDAAVRAETGRSACEIQPTSRLDAEPEVPDVSAPTVSPPPDAVAECDAAGGAGTRVDLGLATATDDRDPAPVVEKQGPDVFPLGLSVVTWAAVDSAGNEGIATQRVEVVDTRPPTFSGTLPGVTVTARGADGTAVSLAPPTATDGCDGPLVATTDAALAAMPIGANEVLWRVTDASGNTRTTTQVVTVAQLRGDLDVDGDVDTQDMNILLASRNQPVLAEPVLRDFDGNGSIDAADQAVFAQIQAGGSDPRDLNGDRKIDVVDGRQLALLCTRARCASQ